MRILGFLALALATTLACGGSSEAHHRKGKKGGASGGADAGGPSSVGGGGRGGSQGGSDAGTAGAAGDGGEGATGGGGGMGDDTCGSTVPAAPLQRLTNAQYDNTVLDLFGDDSSPANGLPPDPALHAGLDPVSTLRVEGYHRIAHDLALAVTADEASVESATGCDLSTESETACRRRFMSERLPLVLRRPLDSDDMADFDAVFARGEELGGGFAGGVRAVLEVALQSPEFLYRVELGEPLDANASERMAGWARPTPYEMAARLSYLYWDTTPDAELVDAAAEGGLRTQEEIRVQATRLLAEPRARGMVRRFYFALLPFGPTFPATGQDARLTNTVAAFLPRETERFIDEVTFEGPGDFSALLTAPFTWVNGPLASFYGISGVTGDEFQRVALDPSRRGGLLTQASFLAVTSQTFVSRPTARGRLVLEKLLCVTIPPNPPEGAADPNPPAGLTTRERVERDTSPPSCAGCHVDLNTVGFAFEHYDNVGAWRDMDNGQPVNASGELRSTDAAGAFNGAIELGQRLAASNDAKHCYAGHWLSYAYGRPEAPADACTRAELEGAFEAGNVRDLLLALSQTETFLFRPLVEGQ